MIWKNNRALLLYYVKLCAPFQIHRLNQTGVTVWKHSIRVKIGNFLTCMTLQFDGWPWNTIGNFFYTESSVVHHFKAIGEFKIELQSGNAQFGLKPAIFWLGWPWNLTDDLKNNKAPLLCCFKLCASLPSHQWIQTGVTTRKRPIWVEIDDFFDSHALEIWQMTLKNIWVPFLCHFKLCTSIQSHW